MEVDGYYVMRHGKARIVFPAGFSAANYPQWLDRDWVARNSAESGAQIPSNLFEHVSCA